MTARLRFVPVDYDKRPEPREPLLQRIADTLQSPRFVLFYLGFYSGCMATVGLALVWARFA